jgi:hypothetical protein
MIYVELWSANFTATVTNKRSHVAKGLVEDLILKYERGDISRLEFVSKLSYRYRKLHVIEL